MREAERVQISVSRNGYFARPLPFTTFSAFSLEAVNMILRGQIILATAYAVSSVAGSIMMLFIGLFATRALA